MTQEQIEDLIGVMHQALEASAESVTESWSILTSRPPSIDSRFSASRRDANKKPAVPPPLLP